MRYRNEIDFLKKYEDVSDSCNKREIVSKNDLNLIKEEHPKISIEFIDYLKEIGQGAFRECQFNVQNYLYDLKDVGLDEHYEVKESIKFFGDNFSGDFAGFDFEKNPELVVEFWHEDGSIYETKKTFKEYIRKQMLMGENGQDTRIK